MQKNQKVATIFGGTGFIGTQIVREMAARGWMVKVASRIPERAYFLKPCGAVGQIVPVYCDYSNEGSIAAAVKGSDFVVNCVGILFQRGKSGFAHVHKEIPESIAKACKKEGVARFVHISVPGIEQDKSRYAMTKFDGEKAIKNIFPDVTILRPSIVFGPEDDFFNKFAALARYLPVLPLIGGGKTKFQPVYVGDVADAVMAVLTLPAGEGGPCGKIYELGGPEILTFKEIYERLFVYTNRKRILMPVPWGLAKIQAFFMGLMPKPLLTLDQIESLKTDYVVDGKALTFDDLGIRPTGMSMILPSYLEQYCPGGRFTDKKRA